MKLDKNSTILITGGTGFVGSHLIELLLAENFNNIHTTSYSDEHGFVGQLIDSDKIHKLDLTDQEQTFHLLEVVKPDVIFHLAALAVVGGSFNNAKKTIMNNMGLQLNLLEAIKEKAPQARTLIIGSGMEYDMIGFHSEKIDELQPLGPSSPYAVSKVAQDLLALSYHYSYQLDIVRARPFNHIGERQTADFAISSFAKQISLIEKGEQEKIMVGNLDAIRDFTDVKDMVKAYLLLIEKGEAGAVYNIGSGEGVKVANVLKKLTQLSDEYIDIEIDQDRIRPLDIPVAVADNQKISSLGWKAEIPIEQTLQRILNYWRSNS